MRVLLVDSDSTLLTSVQAALAAIEGLEIYCAPDASTALQHAHALGGVDLLLTDGGGEFQGELHARAIAPPLQETDRLGVNADRNGQFLAAQVSLDPKQSNTVVDHSTNYTEYCVNTIYYI